MIAATLVRWGAACRTWATVDVALTLVATVWVAIGLLRAPHWTVDDAFIVARYADHLAHHGRLSFNLSGPPVEGFTSPIFVLIGAASSAVGVAAVPTMTALGVAATLSSGVLILGLARELQAPPPAGGLTALIYLSASEHLRHAASGLETEVYLAVEIAAAWALLRALRRPERATAIFLVCGFGCLLRPEGVGMTVVLIGICAVRARARGALSPFLRTATRLLFVPLLIAVIARYAYFHEFLPNTYFAKRSGWNGIHISELMGLGGAVVLDPLIVALGAATLPGLLGVRSRRMSPRAVALTVAAATILLAHLVVYARADLVMNYGRRFAVHGLPWLTVGLLVATARGVERTRALGRNSSAAWVIAGAAALVVVTLPWNHAAEAHQQLYEMEHYEAGLRYRYVPIAEYVRSHLPPTATLAVYPDAGIVPYLTDLTTLDFGKLCDRYLAREARSPQDVAAYFFSHRPDAAVFGFWHGGRAYDAGAEAILKDPAFAASYFPAPPFASGTASGPVLYLRRP